MDHNAGLVYLLFALVAVYLIFLSRARRQRRGLKAQAQLEPGARVMTTSGLFGSVVSVDEETGRVVLEIAPGVHTEWVRPAIAQVVDDTPTTEDDVPSRPADTVVDLTGAPPGGSPPADPPSPAATPPPVTGPAPEPGAPQH